LVVAVAGTSGAALVVHTGRDNRFSGPPGIPAALFAPVFEVADEGKMVLIRGAGVDQWEMGSHQPEIVAGTCEAVEVNRLPGQSDAWSVLIVGLASDAPPLLDGRPLAIPGGTISLRPLRPGALVVAGEIRFDVAVAPDEAWALVDSLRWLLTFWAGRDVTVPILTAPAAMQAT
jgi:hypothetical protein